MILTRAEALFRRAEKLWKVRRGAITNLRLTELGAEDYAAPPHHYIDTHEALVKFAALAESLGVSQAELLRDAARDLMVKHSVDPGVGYRTYLDSSVDSPPTDNRYDVKLERERHLKLLLDD